MMMSDIPQDLIEEILSRVPAESLKRLRSTCKRWNHLFRDQRFKEKHLRKAPKQPRILMLNDYRICSVNVDLNVAPPPIEFKDFHPCSQQVDVVQVFHCGGLLLCNTHKDNEYRLVVWNPCSGETRWIQTTTNNSKGFSRGSVALGYRNNKSFRSYKILNYWSTIYSLDHGDDAGFEIYDLSSDSWRVLDVDFALNCSTRPHCGVSMKGNAYWLGLEKTDVLLGFDFTSDSFRRFCLPAVPSPWNMILSVVRQEKLSLLNWSLRTPYMDVWVTHEIDTQTASWSKLFTVKNPNNFSPCYKSFLADEEKKVVLCCKSAFGGENKKLYTIGEDSEYYTEITSVGSINKTLSPFISSYVPSLVQIQQGGSNGTKSIINPRS